MLKGGRLWPHFYVCEQVCCCRKINLELYSVIPGIALLKILRLFWER
jgi:hypothetical protein